MAGSECFALNLPSAIKNYWGMLWQLQVEASAGEYFDNLYLTEENERKKQNIPIRAQFDELFKVK